MPDHPLADLSDALASLAATAAPGLVTLYPGTRSQRTGFAWQPDVVVTSEQNLPTAKEVAAILPGGATATATLLARDPGTNVALFRLPIQAPAFPIAEPRTGTLALALGGADGEPTAALGVVHRTGPAWESMAGGTIDSLIRLDLRLASIAEGGPVLDAAGGLLGMSTFGPRRRVIVIPASTVRRVIPGLLEGRAAPGWLGIGLQPVGLPQALHAAAGRDSGLMVVSLAPAGPAEQAGILPGDILLEIAGSPAMSPRAVARTLAAARPGQALPLRLLRGGSPLDITATVAPRPAQ